MATDIMIFFQRLYDHLQSMPHGTLMGSEENGAFANKDRGFF